MEKKNGQLRQILGTMGVQITGTQNGAVTIVENKDIQYQSSH